MNDPARLDIRPADPDEILSALALLRSEFPRAADDYVAYLPPQVMVLVAMLDGSRPPVGVVFGRPSTSSGSERAGLLQFLVVDQAQRRTGVGEALVDAFCQKSRNCGSVKVQLHYGAVTFGSERGQQLTAFYVRCGFARAGSYMERRVDLL
ncbi:GNAT family N-acetyltransferase [Cellulomonas sp. Root137]|uniref:GNAT family N-acetyltransferase n=1 Tax=Cellulomonas sp. Root137 TaxID=1736459 RepID=UPI00138F689D|nr:GNAT family N-acetyltransferase [Cellulomonas sp. Root137]